MFMTHRWVFRLDREIANAHARWLDGWMKGGRMKG